MSENTESHFTITFGHSGRVVKKSGRGPGDGVSGSRSAYGSKRSVKDRLGTIVDDSLQDGSHHGFKRQRVGQNHEFHIRNGSIDTSFENGDLRLKLMQKNVSRQFQNNDLPTDTDLRVKLSQKANLPPADGSCSPKATLGKRKNMFETRDIDNGRLHNTVERRPYDSEKQNRREPRDTYTVERRSMLELRGTYSGERQSMRDPRRMYSDERQNMREPRDTYSNERQSMGVPRGTYTVERQSMGMPRDNYSVERRSMREPRDNYNVERRSIREPRGSHNDERRNMREARNNHIVERQSLREPRDNYNVESRSMPGPRDSYNIERRNMRVPVDPYHFERRTMPDRRDSYNVGRRSMREPRDTYNIERRHIREPRGGYNVEAQRMPEGRDNYSSGRRNIQEPKETYIERHSMREPKNRYSPERCSLPKPRDGFSGRDRYDNRRMSSAGPSSKMGSDLPAVGHARTPYASDNLRRRSPVTDSGTSVSPESSEEPQRKPLTRTYDNLREKSPESEFASSLSPESSEEWKQKTPTRTYDDDNDDDDDGTSNLYRRNDVSSPQRTAKSATIIKQPGSNAVPHIPGNSAPVTVHYPQSSAVVRRIPNHGEQPTIDGFLESLDLEEYSIRFKDEELDYHALTGMSDTELQELGIPMGPRRRILHALMNRMRR